MLQHSLPKERRFVGIGSILKARRGKQKMHWSDYVTYGYLLLGVFVMLLPVLWVVISSFKTQGNLLEYPPTILPMQTETVVVEGFEKPLPLFEVTEEDGSVRVLAQIRRVGIRAQMVDPGNPAAGRLIVDVNKAEPIRGVHFALENYTRLFKFAGDSIYSSLYNSVFITLVATVLTLIFNSMAAFALSKYQFRGSNMALLMILSVLMVPATVVLVPIFMIVSGLGLYNNLWGIILPSIATPTGVFLLRQYMLTIPDELLDAARMDHASEWQIYWRIMLPLSTPALSVVAIFSIMSRWNDFLLPLVILTKPENFTLQLALASYEDDTGIQYDLLLAMTCLTALPLALAFIFLQRFITTGIASSGVK